MGFGWQRAKIAYLPAGDLNVVKSSSTRATFHWPPPSSLSCTMLHSREFRNLGRRRPVVLKSFVKPSCSSLSFPSPSCVAPIREINPLQLRLSYKSNYHLGKVFFASSLSPILFNTQLALSSSSQSLASSPPSFHTGSPGNTIASTIDARNQPPLRMAGVRFLPCTRCRTKRRRRLRDLPMSRNNTSLSSLTAGGVQY